MATMQESGWYWAACGTDLDVINWSGPYESRGAAIDGALSGTVDEVTAEFRLIQVLEFTLSVSRNEE